MTALAITIAAFILCYPISQIAQALRRIARALEADQLGEQRSMHWHDDT